MKTFREFLNEGKEDIKKIIQDTVTSVVKNLTNKGHEGIKAIHGGVWKKGEGDAPNNKYIWDSYSIDFTNDKDEDIIKKELNKEIKKHKNIKWVVEKMKNPKYKEINIRARFSEDND